MNKKNKITWNRYDPVFDHHADLSPLFGTWQGHLHFAYDLVRNIKPKLVVELGVQSGHSFLAFAKAVKDIDSETVLIGVDTWEGDRHTKGYDSEVLLNLKDLITKYFNNLNIQLNQTTFEQARNSFDNNLKIDILHIDGYHTYKAVKSDFDNWESLVSDEGVILLHDIAVHEKDFGVYRLWEEIKDSQKYFTLEFEQSHGLGVVFKNPNTEISNIFNWQLEYNNAHQSMAYKLIDGIHNKELSELKMEYQKINNENNEYLERINQYQEMEKHMAALEARMSNINNRKIIKLLNRIYTILGKGQI